MSWFCCCGCKYRFRGFDLPNPLQHVTHWTVDGNTASTTTAETTALEFCRLALRGDERSNYSFTFAHSVSGKLTVTGESGVGFTIDSGTGTVYASYHGDEDGPYFAEVPSGSSITIATGTGGGYVGSDVYVDGDHAFSLPVMTGTVTWRLIEGSSASITVDPESLVGTSGDVENGCQPVGIYPWPAAGTSSITLDIENEPRPRSDFEGPWVSPCPSCVSGTFTLYPAFGYTFPINNQGLWLSEPFEDYASNCGLYRIYLAECGFISGWAGIRIEAGAVRYFGSGDPEEDSSNWQIDGWFDALPDELAGLGLSTATLNRGGTSRTGTGGLLIGGSLFCHPVSCTATPNY